MAGRRSDYNTTIASLLAPPEREGSSLIAAPQPRVSARALFRACYRPHLRAVEVPLHMELPATLDADKWCDHDDDTKELLAHTQSFQIGPVTEEQRSTRAPQGSLRTVLHLERFVRLTTLIITKQRLDAADIKLPPHLQYLDLSFNAFRVVPLAVLDLRFLAVLRLDGNHLSSVRALESLPLQQLRELHFADNAFLARVDLTGLETLTLLDLRRCHARIELTNVHVPPSALLLDAGAQPKWCWRGDAPPAPPGSEPGVGVGVGVGVDVGVDVHPPCPLAQRDSHAAMQQVLHCHLWVAKLSALRRSALVAATRARVQDLCSFATFFPTFDAQIARGAQDGCWLQFVAFVRFCLRNECFLDWARIDALGVRDSARDPRVFRNSRLVLALDRVFPAANTLAPSLVLVAPDDALFAAEMMLHFSNANDLVLARRREEERAQALQEANNTHALLREDLRAAASTPLYRYKLNALVDFEYSVLALGNEEGEAMDVNS